MASAHSGDRMRKLIVSNVMSLDGFFEGRNPDKGLDWFVPDEEFFAYAKDMLRAVDTILFGRVTYLHMLNYWPSAPPDEIADQMNNLPKIVFSSTLKSAEWNNTKLVKSSIEEEVSRLKQQPGKDMVVLGSAKLASFLLQVGLIDEYRIILSPVLLGCGNPLFTGMTERIHMKLLATKVFASGTVLLSYQKS